jgi:hypothetical protein
MSGPHHGPHVVLTLEEIKRIYDAMRFCRDPVALSLRAKCEAALKADSKFRQP